MKKYLITITQTLVGAVDIEAENKEAALQEAELKYITKGYELPDMDVIEPLKFDALEVAEKQRPCVFYSQYGEIGGCLCNNDIDEQGECIYKGGHPPRGKSNDCKHYK